MVDEIWVLGATGRTGSGVARNLAARGLAVGLVGRDRGRLEAVAATVPGSRAIVAADLDEAAVAIVAQGPAVVVNTVGPFATTAVPIARVSRSYVDLSNELFATRDVLALHDVAVAESRCLVPGAGFGFIGTEAVVRRLCGDRPPAAKVRVDAIPFLADGGDILGEALAATIIDSLASGGWRYERGELVPAAAGGDAEVLTLPDGRTLTAGGFPSGDLLAAQRASRAAFATAGSSAVPGTALTRLILPIAAAAMRMRPVRDFAVRRLAQVVVPPPTVKEGTTWGHARVEWDDGTIREGWLRTGDAMTFTVAVMAEVTARLAAGKGRPGAFTAAELFGPELAEAVGAEVRVEERGQARQGDLPTR